MQSGKEQRKKCKERQKKKKSYGGAGYRSRYLSHAKRALYHLSYAPYVFNDAFDLPKVVMDTKKTCLTTKVNSVQASTTKI